MDVFLVLPMRLIKLFILFVALSSCGKKESFSGSVVGHGCMGLEILNSVYHDNSKEAFDLATGLNGSGGVEVDLQLSLNGTIWLFHDDDLLKETGKSGCVSGYTDEQLHEMRYKSLHKERLVRLIDLDLNRLKGKQLFLDLRHFNQCESIFYDPQDWLTALGQIDISGEVEVFVVLSRNNWASTFKNAGYNVLLSVFDDNDLASSILLMNSIDGIMVKNSLVNKEDVDNIRSIGKKVFIFEMRAPKSIRKAMAKDPDGVVSDDLRAAIIEKD
jgi:glycerophosphoryl diester phosphodiesterase